MSRLVIGCGYLGLRVARRWLALGHHVLATTRGRADELRAAEIEPIVCDVLNPCDLPAVETVVYAVGLDRTAPATMRDVYVTGLGNVLDRLPPPARFIYVSSTSVYGQTDGAWVDETSATEPIDDSGRVVLEAEQLLQRRSPDAIRLRFAGIYGPGRLLRADGLRRGEPITGDPGRWLNLIHVDDGATAVLTAEVRGAAGKVYNVCDDEPVPRGEFYVRLARLLGLPQPRFVPGPDRGGHRRISNRRMRESLMVALAFASCSEGLAESLGERCTRISSKA